MVHLFFPVVCFIHVSDQTLAGKLDRDKGLFWTRYHELQSDSFPSHVYLCSSYDLLHFRDCLREHIRNATDPEIQCPSQDGDLACHEKITAQEIRAVSRHRATNLGIDAKKTGPLPQHGSFISKTFAEYFLRISIPWTSFPYYRIGPNYGNYGFSNQNSKCPKFL